MKNFKSFILENNSETKHEHDMGYSHASQGKKQNPYEPGSISHAAYERGHEAYKRHFGENKEVEIQEGKMSEIASDIEDHLGKHIDEYKKRGGAEHFASQISKTHDHIAKLHGLEQKHAAGLVNDYVEGRLKEEAEQLTELTHEVGISYDKNAMRAQGKVRVAAKDHDDARTKALDAMKGREKNIKVHSSRNLASGKETDSVKFNEEAEQIEERNKKNALVRKAMDAARGARYKLNNPVPDAEPEHKTAQAHNKALGRALRKEETDIEEQAPVAPSLVKHKISVTVSDPNHTMVSKRKEKIQKTVIVTHSDNKEGARAVGEKYYKKKGYRVHDSHHAGMVNEEVEQIDELDLSTLQSYQSKRGNPEARKKTALAAMSDHFGARTGKPSAAHQKHGEGLNRARNKIEAIRKRQTAMNPQKPRPQPAPKTGFRSGAMDDTYGT